MPGAASAAHLLPSPRAPQPNNPAALLQQRTRCSLAVFFLQLWAPGAGAGHHGRERQPCRAVFRGSFPHRSATPVSSTPQFITVEGKQRGVRALQGRVAASRRGPAQRGERRECPESLASCLRGPGAPTRGPRRPPASSTFLQTALGKEALRAVQRGRR